MPWLEQARQPPVDHEDDLHLAVLVGVLHQRLVGQVGGHLGGRRVAQSR